MSKTLPQRVSLASETARVLREQIEAGEWPALLPGERDLCARLRVSRPTLRAALKMLRQSGWVEAPQQGRRCSIRESAAEENSRTVPASNRVVLLTPTPIHRLPPFFLFWLNEVRQQLAEQGFELDARVSHAADLQRPEQLLERTVAEARAAAWILFTSTEPMQRWFSARRLPCMITGSSFANVELPSVDVDQHATSRHAAGLLIARGHRRLALLAPAASTAGEQASEAGFLEGCRRPGGDVTARVIRHDQSVEDICRKVDRLLGAPHPTTGLLVGRSAHALTVHTHLLRRGLRLPADVSLIARDDDSYLDFVVPRLARYACPPATFARHVSRILVQLAKSGSVPPRKTLLMPDFLKGETLSD